MRHEEGFGNTDHTTPAMAVPSPSPPQLRRGAKTSEIGPDHNPIPKSLEDEESSHASALDGWKARPHPEILCEIARICWGYSLGDAGGKELGKIWVLAPNAFES
jgi:hypothetical protein